MRCPASILIALLSASIAAQATAAVPRHNHVVVVIMENHSSTDIYGSASAPYLNGTLIAQGAKFTNSFAVTHPSQPNYIALFSGSTQGVVNDSCPHSFGTGNLAQQLIDAGLSFAQFSEDLPAIGDTSCTVGLYARKHNPAPDFPALPTTTNQPFSNFAGALSSGTLPTLSFVVPNLCNDMHGAAPCVGMDLIALGDQWLQANIPQFLNSRFAKNGLLIVTWDEDDSSGTNLIPTIFFGTHVRKNFVSSTTITHFSVLRTLEDMYKLAPLGSAAAALPISDVWDDVIFADEFE